MVAVDNNQEYEEFHFSNDENWKNDLPDFFYKKAKTIAENPKITVIIANYNNVSYLQRMLNSLVRQSISPDQIQIMFIDDKSNDKSLEIASQYMDRYPSIEIYSLRENTGGAYGPRNIGILNARGEYLVFLDADDWYAPTALEYMSDLLDRSGDDIAFTGMIQSCDGNLSLKSKPYFFEGEKFNRNISELSAEFYAWLGPQSIIVRRNLVLKNNLHFVSQRVADDVVFFYQAMRCAKKITQGAELTTYLNRDNDNRSLSKKVNREFMVSWLRAIGYINQTCDDDASKQRFLSRRLEWLVYDFCLRRDTGYKLGINRLIDFKLGIDQYIGQLMYDPTVHFQTGARKVAWQYLMSEQYQKLLNFNRWHSARHFLKNRFNMYTKKGDLYYFPTLNSKIPDVPINVRAMATGISDRRLSVDIFTHEQINYFIMRNIEDPFVWRKIDFKKINDISYQVLIPEDFENDSWKFYIVTNLFHEHGIENFKKVIRNINSR